MDAVRNNPAAVEPLPDELTPIDILCFVYRRWVLILIPVLLIVPAALYYRTSSGPKGFQAAASVDISPDIRPEVKRWFPSAQAYQMLADSQRVTTALNRRLDEQKPASSVKGMTRTSRVSAGPPILLELTVLADAPETAVAAANAWSEACLQTADDLTREAIARREAYLTGAQDQHGAKIAALNEQQKKLETESDKRRGEVQDAHEKKISDIRMRREKALVDLQVSEIVALTEFNVQTEKPPDQDAAKLSLSSLTTRLNALQRASEALHGDILSSNAAIPLTRLELEKAKEQLKAAPPTIPVRQFSVPPLQPNSESPIDDPPRKGAMTEVPNPLLKELSGLIASLERQLNMAEPRLERLAQLLKKNEADVEAVRRELDLATAKENTIKQQRYAEKEKLRLQFVGKEDEIRREYDGTLATEDREYKRKLDGIARTLSEGTQPITEALAFEREQLAQGRRLLEGLNMKDPSQESRVIQAASGVPVASAFSLKFLLATVLGGLALGVALALIVEFAPLVARANAARKPG